MKQTMYKMKMRFNLTLADVKLNDLLSSCGMNGTICIPGTILNISQTLPFIPDDLYIDKVCEIIKTKYKTENYIIVKVEFDGYDEFIAKEVEV